MGNPDQICSGINSPFPQPRLCPYFPCTHHVPALFEEKQKPGPAHALHTCALVFKFGRLGQDISCYNHRKAMECSSSSTMDCWFIDFPLRKKNLEPEKLNNTTVRKYWKEPNWGAFSAETGSTGQASFQSRCWRYEKTLEEKQQFSPFRFLPPPRSETESKGAHEWSRKETPAAVPVPLHLLLSGWV